MDQQPNEQAVQKAQQMADERFQHSDQSHPAMPMLKKIFRDRMLKAIENESPEARCRPERPAAIRPTPPGRGRRQPLGPLEAAVERIKLPSLPHIWLELRQAMEDPSTSSQDLARIISLDPKLTVTVISLVNSPLFGLPVKVETLSRAVTVLGTKQISGLAIGSLLVALFQDVPPDVISVEDFWKHSVSTAILSHNLAVFRGSENPERFFVAGLLHDLGRIALYSSEPELARMALALERMSPMDLDEAERKVFDFDHAMLGALLLQRWHMPNSVVFSALTHHNQEECLRNEVSTVVHVANALAVAMDLGGCGEVHAPFMGVEAFQRMHMDPEELAHVVEDMDRQLDEVLPSLLGWR